MINLTETVYRKYKALNSSGIIFQQEVMLRPNGSAEIIYYSDLSGEIEFKYKKIVDIDEARLRFFLEKLPESTAENFKEAKEALLGAII